MTHYIKDFEDGQQITRIVCDFLAIAECSDTSFILVAMALHAFDKVALDAPLESTLEALFIGLHNLHNIHNAMYER